MGLRLVWQPCPLCPALYTVSLRRLGTLPAASFRFHLSVDTLAVRLTLPTTKRVVDFHHQAIAHAGRTTKIPRNPAWFRGIGCCDMQDEYEVHKVRTYPKTMLPTTSNESLHEAALSDLLTSPHSDGSCSRNRGQLCMYAFRIHGSLSIRMRYHIVRILRCVDCVTIFVHKYRISKCNTHTKYVVIAYCAEHISTYGRIPGRQGWSGSDCAARRRACAASGH